MVQRLTYRSCHSYATNSNQHRIVKTPGGKLVYQNTKKRASRPKCSVTGKRIQGIPHLRPTEYRRSRLPRNRRTVNRAYGGVLSGGAVRESLPPEEQKRAEEMRRKRTEDMLGSSHHLSQASVTGIPSYWGEATSDPRLVTINDCLKDEEGFIPQPPT